MNRRTFLTASVSAAGAGALVNADTAAEANDGWPSHDHVAAHYKKAMEFFRAALPAKFATLPVEIRDDSWIRRMKASHSQDEDYVLVSTPASESLRGIVRVRRRDGELLLAGADTNPGSDKTDRRVPTWSIADAIEKATAWLKRFGWEVPPNFQIGKVDYSQQWYIHWHRLYGTIPELRRGAEPSDEYTAILGEGDSSVRLVRHVWGPEPATLTPKLTRTEALMKAAAVMPAIMATEVYKSWMPAGMSPLGFEKAELVVLRPNWLLDANRYSLGGPKGPVERRLCWQVTFQLFKWERAGEKNGKPVFKSGGSGQVEVDVDAVTGEVVGGDMLPTTMRAAAPAQGK